MDIPLELAYHNMTHWDGLSAAVRREVAGLEHL